ncbi:Protein oar precursor [Myxococcus hansupus]|uniref:Protein oar n=1 Tax=Pseudomyxococcus hansupus TaxID=1297742 RepID=A0A0H4XLI7_9BACT|nr:mucoidy inhibitor MuiA family protein [Myxococcus hansupus]AKQ69127.1 Protein oar precursor [Myxococcus hansupus]
MYIFGIGLMAASVLGATLEAPVTSVTVYSDQAQVVRSGSVTVHGSQRVAFPRLPQRTDIDSVRVEAEGAEVSHVDVRAVKGEAFSQDEARKLITQMEDLDVALARLDAERDVHQAQIEALRRVRPKVSGDGEAARAQAHPSGWSTAASFLVDTLARLDARIRALEAQAETLRKQQQQHKVRAAALGKTFGEQGFEVAATLAGQGATKVKLTYLTRGARWHPRYELQLQPESQRMQMAFYGRVSQETGEDWEGARLTLSTALPANATAMPRLTTWKLGIRERFIPSPPQHREALRPAPAAPASNLRATSSPEQVLRARLLVMAGERPQTPPEPAKARDAEAQHEGRLSTLMGSVLDARTRQTLPHVVVTATSSSLQGEQVVETNARGEYRIPALPSGLYTLHFEREGSKTYARDQISLRPSRTIRVNAELLPEHLEEVVVVGGAPTIGVGANMAGVNVDVQFVPRSSIPQQSVALTPPPAWRPPTFDPGSPVAVAGGYNLTFTSQRLETLLTGKGERSIPLVSESWPVQVERQVFPALSQNAYLVATLQGPARTVLPGGDASLYVGTDPAGTATLGTIVPGDTFTLPMGIDRAVRSARNVRLVEAEKGFISKEEVGTYEVTLEVPNPYPFPLPVSVMDQLPLNTDGKVEVTLVRAVPAVQPEAATGKLQWNVTVPPSSKSLISFQYTLSRPKGWRLHQK